MSLQADVSFFPEEKCLKDEHLDEDACLNACLVDKFVNVSGCIHPRLKILLYNRLVNRTENGRDDVQLCNYNNLSNLVTRNLQADQTDGKGKDLDPGDFGCRIFLSYEVKLNR